MKHLTLALAMFTVLVFATTSVHAKRITIDPSDIKPKDFMSCENGDTRMSHTTYPDGCIDVVVETCSGGSWVVSKRYWDDCPDAEVSTESEDGGSIGN